MNSGILTSMASYSDRHEGFQGSDFIYKTQTKENRSAVNYLLALQRKRKLNSTSLLSSNSFSALVPNLG